MNITMRQAEFFVAVAGTGHFGRAADELFVSQPVVSQEIRRLERNLGLSLFDRSTRSVVLTAAGETLLPLARALLEAGESLTDVAARLTGPVNSGIRLAATPSAMNALVPDILRVAEETMPGVAVEELAVETGEAGAALTSGRADIGIGRYIDVPARFRTEIIRWEPVYVALSSDHPLASARGIRLADLADVPLLLWPRERNPEYYDRLLEICAQASLEPLVLVSRPRIVGARSYLISEGRAFGLVPESTANLVLPGITTIPLVEPQLLPMSVAWLADEPRQQVLALVELVRRVAGQA
ncbi:DNA-binding transcriptional LysR family regulator [Cryobacterium mesophilum]|uniref:LysR family transcriptional regulator n=1 Tax=Terrimesophilobacter mesophilus TaxID=433647 RepID=A0A4R8VCC5_9MICO|nr:LysR family transcriptional regulator [Terrimesophilobacter mesophilus]MBB5633795.1 DNA-binding transcriptional LysR family regulator [Terrimesophilobacter mesophilus]TFB80473.1 LysR family transcriptional regulator [Terrimesophilobacter mesophilus]